MIDCIQYRRAVLADPRDSSPEVAAHRETCAECRQFTEQLLRFEGRLERALRVDAGAPGAAQVLPFPARRAARRGWLALAASVLIAFVVAGGVWLAVTGPSLAADVVTHMAGEPDAWQQTDVPVPGSDLSAVLRNAHLRLNPNVGVVSYAQSCEFRGHHVPHLVVQSAAGPVTVMVLVHEQVPAATPFDENGYRGVIVPVAGHGSIAVLTRGAATDQKAVEKIAARVQDAIVWTP
jgi:uncharacterized protein DUF3379